MKYLKNWNVITESQEDGVIVFLHGLESSSNGSKAEFLTNNFSDTYIPQLNYKEESSDDIFNSILSNLEMSKVKLIIGSSLGGYLAYCLCKKLNVPGLLFNPALYGNSLGIQFDDSGTYTPNLTVVLGKNDMVVKPNIVVEYLMNNYVSSQFNIFYEEIEHRVPAEIFEKWTLKLTNPGIRTFEEFKASEVGAKKGVWTKFNIPRDQQEKDEYEEDIFDMIDTAYKEIGGYAKIKNPDDVFADETWDVWKGVDIDQDDEFDCIVWGETTPFGIKSCGVGHDGSDESKKGYLKLKADDFSDRSKNYYGEVSDKLAAILINKYKVPVVEDENKIRQILGDGKVQEFSGVHPDVKTGKLTERDAPGKGWYKRIIGGHPHWKIMVGNPK